MRRHARHQGRRSRRAGAHIDERQRAGSASGRRRSCSPRTGEDADAPGNNILGGGVITDVSFVGVSTQYLVRMPWGQELHGLRAEHRPPRALPRRATKVELSWRPEYAFLLDAQPGRARGRRARRRRLSAVARCAPAHAGPKPSAGAAEAATARPATCCCCPGASGWCCSSSSRSTRWSRPASTTRPGRCSPGYDDDLALQQLRRRAPGLLAAAGPVAVVRRPGHADLPGARLRPLAYAIAFKAGRWKNLMLVLVIAPFFTSFLIRTLSWKLILADDGFVVNTAAVRAHPGRRRAAAGHPGRRRSPA